MRDIERRILDFIALATPINDDRAPCCCNVRAASGAQVARLLQQLEGTKVTGKTHERPQSAPGRILLHAAPWLRRQIAVEGRIGA